MYTLFTFLTDSRWLACHFDMLHCASPHLPSILLATMYFRMRITNAWYQPTTFNPHSFPRTQLSPPAKVGAEHFLVSAPVFAAGI